MSAERLRKLIQESERIVGFTGAGVSTDSGIADYRSQGGIWEKFQPVYIDEFLADEPPVSLGCSRRSTTLAPCASAILVPKYSRPPGTSPR